MCSMLMVRQCCGVQCRVTCTPSLMHACCRISTFHKESWIKTKDFFVDFNTGFLVAQMGTNWQDSFMKHFFPVCVAFFEGQHVKVNVWFGSSTVQDWVSRKTVLLPIWPLRKIGQTWPFNS